MRTAPQTAAFVAMLLVGVGAGSARADELKVRVPFPFVAGSQAMPAGEYVVEPMNDEPTVVVLRTADAKSAAIVLTTPVVGHPEGDNPSLTFTKNESRYHLSTIWKADGEGFALPR